MYFHKSTSKTSFLLLLVHDKKWLRWVDEVVFYNIIKGMFKRVNEQELLKRNVRDGSSLNKLRILQSIPLKKLNDSESNHSSVMTNSLHSSIKNVPNASIISLNSNSDFSFRSSLKKSLSRQRQKISPQKRVISKQISVQQLLEKYYHRSFVKSLVQYLNKDWSNLQKQYLAEKKLQNYVQIVFQRGNWLKDLSQEFIEKEYGLMGNEDRKMMASILFHEEAESIRDIQTVIPEIIKKIPQEKLLKQETILEELSSKLLEIYDPKFSYSNAKIKERMALYLQQFICKRNEVKADISTKLKNNLQFIERSQQYFNSYQRQVIRLKNLLQATELQKDKYYMMLSSKSSFAPLQVDYDKLYEMKDEAQQLIKHDLEVNIIQFHEDKHKRNNKIIFELEEGLRITKDANEKVTNEYNALKEEIYNWKKNIPLKVDASAQVFLISQGNTSQNMTGGSGNLVNKFLQKVVTPFSFSKEITASLLNILTIDKILYDYEIIRQKLGLKSFETFIFQWFIIRTGCKKIAQVFIKNFQYSLKELKNSHKRFWIFQRICGWSWFKQRNMQEDLEGIFFSSHICWYYLVRLALMYRKKLSDNPTGYHIFPPLPCQQIFKIPLRKVYEIVQQFLTSQQIQIPSDITNRIDRYCINQISKFKSNDEQFQKQLLEEIHILRQINFDLIAGFVLEYVCSIRCGVIEKLLRTIQNRQKEDGNVLGYNQFELIYKKFYKDKRAKIELVYAKLCMVNQHQMLNVQNISSVALAIIEDETPLRTIFEKLQPFRALILSQKANLMRGQKKVANPNSYQNFRERFYHEFYDFYSTTAFLQDLFKIIKALTKKRLKNYTTNEHQINNLLQLKLQKPSAASNKKRKSSQSNNEDENESQQRETKKEMQGKDDEAKGMLVAKLQEWGKIMVRVPRFTPNVLTIEQIVIHNMRRKEMIDASQFAWRVLRQILIILGKD